MASIISGTKIAKSIRTELTKKVAKLFSIHNKVPGLGVILVGNRPDSATYVKWKTRAAKQIGIRDFQINLPEDVTQKNLLNQVELLNENPDVNGILVQLPLPSHINERTVLETVSPNKDVDGFHISNLGALATKGSEPLFVPCTAIGVIEMLKRSNIEIEGKEAVVVGRSAIVGMPVQLLLINENATVTVCHSRTRDLPAVVKRADIVVAAIGRPEFVKKEWIKEGSVVIDVGINEIEDSTKSSGKRLVGDVEYDARDVCSMISPVPGGVGPMTIAMLMHNTVKAFEMTLN